MPARRAGKVPEVGLVEVASSVSHGNPRQRENKIHPRRFTLNMKMMFWKIIFLFQGCILRFHINLLGCTLLNLFVRKRFFMQ